MAKRFTPVEKTINRLFAKDSMISDELLEEKMRTFSKLSMSYFLLLTASIIIATLGLLMDASAVVIGSMIISPLTWPMFGLADGAALGNRKRIKANLYILVASVVYGILLAYILTVFSPLKVVNTEILSRSTPTLLDAIVAITAGAIGMLAIVRRNISDTVAGVAVALSLTPPLCVVGISLALSETDIVKGSLLLLITNALSITLVAGLILVLVHYSWRRKLRMAPKAFGVMLLSLLITAIPLYRLLSVYSLESSSYAVVQTELNDYVKAISLSGSVQNISTNLDSQSGEDVLVIDADIFLPANSTLTFDDKDRLVSALTAKLNRLVDLRLRVQNVSLLSNVEDVQKQDTIRRVREAFSAGLLELNSELRVNDLDISETENVWIINAQLSGAPTIIPNEKSINNLDEKMEKVLNKKINLNISFIPVTEIKTERQTSLDSLRLELQNALDDFIVSAELASLFVSDPAENGVSKVSLEVKLPDNQDISLEIAQNLKQIVTNKLTTPVEFKIRVLRFNETTY